MKELKLFFFQDVLSNSDCFVVKLRGLTLLLLARLDPAHVVVHVVIWRHVVEDIDVVLSHALIPAPHATT